jgi:putative spermidine/putrescine transport system substrate-binding protein
MNTKRSLGLLVGVAILASACSGGGASTAPSAAATSAASQPAASQAASTAPSAAAATPGPSLPTAADLGSPQGQTINVLAWPGYVENGSTYPEYDWVTAFQKETGCTVKPQAFGTSDEAYTLFSTNPEQFDIVSASGDASLRLVRGGFVQPVNTDLVKNYADIFPALKNKPYNTVDGVPYGIPHGRGSNLLMWRTDQVTPAPTTWAQMFDPANGYKVSIYDAPIYIADAAVVLMKTKPDLGIKNPYALDDTQFAAAIDLLKQQKPAITQRWVDYTKQMTDFESGTSNVGTTWQVIANLLKAEKPPVAVDLIKPTEGATGWSDTWMINSKSKNLACAYAFIDHLVSPKTNAEIADYFGEAPANSKSCELTPAEFTPSVSGSTNMADHCKVFHANDDAFWQDVWYWQTPEATCVDGRTDVQCKDFGEWIKAWTEVKG